MKITKRSIDAFKYQGDGQSRDVRWDAALPGFGVRIYPTNRKAFVLSYRDGGGRKRLLTLGTFGKDLTLDEARDRARRELGKVLDGKDPLAARRRDRSVETFADLARLYVERHASTKRSGKDDERKINRDLLPKLEPGVLSSANALSAATYEIILRPERVENVAQWVCETEAAVSRALSAETIGIERKRKGKIIHFDARSAIADFEVSGQAGYPDGKPALRLSLTLRYGEGAKPKISEILATCLGLSQDDCLRAHVRKLGVRWKAGKTRDVEYAI